MTGPVIQFFVSLAAVAAVVGLAHLLGFSRPARLATEREARELFRLAAGGFEPTEIVLDRQMRSAVARNAEGQIAVLLAHGNKYVARKLTRAVWIECAGDQTLVAAAELGNGPLVIDPESNISHWADSVKDGN